MGTTHVKTEMPNTQRVLGKKVPALDNLIVIVYVGGGGQRRASRAGWYRTGHGPVKATRRLLPNLYLAGSGLVTRSRIGNDDMTLPHWLVWGPGVPYV